jgi:hypothetical protein
MAGASMSTILIRSGYAFSRVFDITFNGSVEDLTGATINAMVKNRPKSTQIIASVTQDSGATGADWLNGAVAVEFSASDTATLNPEEAWIELKIMKGGKALPCDDIPVIIERGFNS